MQQGPASQYRRPTAAASALLGMRAAALLQGTERRLGQNPGQRLEIIERIAGFRRRFHLLQNHVAHDAAVLADPAVPGHEIVDLHLAHLRSDPIGVIGPDPRPLTWIKEGADRRKLSGPTLTPINAAGARSPRWCGGRSRCEPMPKKSPARSRCWRAISAGEKSCTSIGAAARPRSSA